MTFTVRDVAIPMYKRGLRTLDHLLTKLEEHAQAQGVDASTLLDAKLAPDMFDFKKQVQVATDHAKGGSARLAGLEPPKFLDNETSVAELRVRVNAIRDYVDSIEAKLFEGAEDREIKLVFPWATYEFTGAKFLTNWSLPNFLFHVTTAYNILRSNGVVIGKADFLGK